MRGPAGGAPQANRALPGHQGQLQSALVTAQAGLAHLPDPQLSPMVSAAAWAAARPSVAVRQAACSAPRRNARRAAQRLRPARAAEDDRAAQLKAAMEQVQSNPEARPRCWLLTAL